MAIKLKLVLNWFVDLFKTRYKITVSFNKEYGDADDKIYITKKIITKKEKHLKFRTNSGEVIQFTGAEGLNYKIEEI